MRVIYLIFILSVAFSAPALSGINCNEFQNKTVKADVTKVADGDTATVTLRLSGKVVKVRFYGADTPESEWPGHWPEQDFSKEAKQFTINALANQLVEISFTGERTYSRCVGEIFVGGESHSLALINGGYAWWNSRYAPDRTDLQQAHAEAKREKRGLWASPTAQAPWDYRRQYR